MKETRLIRPILLPALPLLAAVPFSAYAAEISFSGASKEVIAVKPDASSGLSAVYVAYGVSGLSVRYNSQGRTVTWEKFGSMGGGSATPVDDVVTDGNYSVLPAVEGGCGYIITDGSTRLCFWIVDYLTSPTVINSVEMLPESDCTRASIGISGQASPIYFYSVNGRRMELSRELSLRYTTLVYDNEAAAYIQDETTVTIAGIEGHVSVDAPYCDTDFTLSGDRFLSKWGLGKQEASSPFYTAKAVTAHVDVNMQGTTPDNQQAAGSDDGLGGSAPCQIVFTAAVTDAAIYHEWQMSDTEEFDDIKFRSSDLILDYTFRDYGTTYVRLETANSDASCEWTSPSFEINIGESALICPNAFSPGASEGINDEWKVSYKSIVDFDCHIFTRWGKEVAHLTDPSQSWNGYIGGKLVPSGVYYYVIKARGADGRRYNLKGDINIINKKTPITGAVNPAE